MIFMAPPDRHDTQILRFVCKIVDEFASDRSFRSVALTLSVIELKYLLLFTTRE